MLAAKQANRLIFIISHPHVLIINGLGSGAIRRSNVEPRCRWINRCIRNRQIDDVLIGFAIRIRGGNGNICISNSSRLHGQQTVSICTRYLKVSIRHDGLIIAGSGHGNITKRRIRICQIKGDA